MHTPKSRLAARHVVKLDCGELLPGMYICELDCAWSDTPFPIDGFHLKNVEDVQRVLKFCRSVYIDTNRGATPHKLKLNRLTILSSARKAAPVSATIKVDRATYPITRSIKQLLDRTLQSYEQIKIALNTLGISIIEQKGEGKSKGENEGESEQLKLELLDRPMLA